MKVDDLRAPNLVEFDGVVCTARSISTSWDRLFDLVENDQVKPIPLTEDWLVKFGFEKEGNMWVRKDFAVKLGAHNHLIDRYLSASPGVFKWICLYGTDCKYVHDLQNAYPLLMRGEELTI